MITPYTIAQKFIVRRELSGPMNDPLIMEWLKLDNRWPENDETPWCSAFVNYIAWIAGVRRTKSLLARSWLGVGMPIQIGHAHQGFDVVVLKRGGDGQPGPENTTAPGHVGFYAFHHKALVYILGGNQDDSVCISEYPISRVIGVRRLE